MRLIPILALGLLTVSCAADPIDTPGTWRLRPQGLNANDENLRAMLVNPGDLTAGHGDAGATATNAASAARRELAGRRAPLLNASSTVSLSGAGVGVGLGGQGQTAGQGGGAGRAE